MLLQLFVAQLYGQQFPITTFSLAANHFISSQVEGLQLDWRLDLGLTSMSLIQSDNFHFTAGFLQPTVNRFTNDAFVEKFNPSIELKNILNRNAIVLFSKEPDLVLFGFNIFDLYGQVVMSDQTKYRSGYAGRFININAMASGVYIMHLFYLPEQMTFDRNTNYWMKTIKFIKP
jgi:hypothetical protein